MKTNIYFNATNATADKKENLATAANKEIRSEVNARHTQFNADKRATTNDFKRVYLDWLTVFKKQPAHKRMVAQFNIDTMDKLVNYIQPVCIEDTLCSLTTSDKRADEAVAKKTIERKGESVTLYAVPIKFTVSSLEDAVKFSAEYYAGLHENLATKFNEAK